MDDLVLTIARRLQYGIRDLVRETEETKLRYNGAVQSIYENSTGIAVTPDGQSYIGSHNTAIVVDAQRNMISASADELQFNGNLRLFPSDAHKTFEINSGSINSQLIPPPIGSQRSNAQYMLVLVKTSPSETAFGANIPENEKGVYVTIPPHSHAIPSGGETLESQQQDVAVSGITLQPLFGPSVLTKAELERRAKAFHDEYEAILSELRKIQS